MTPFGHAEHSLPREVYSEVIVPEAIRAFDRWLHVSVVEVTASEVKLHIDRRAQETSEEPPHIIAEFLNFALQLAARREDDS